MRTRRSFRPLYALGAAVLMVVSLTGCSGEADSKVTSPKVQENSQEATRPKDNKKSQQCGTNKQAITAIETARSIYEGVAIAIERKDTKEQWEVEIAHGDELHVIYVTCDGASVKKSDARIETIDSDDQHYIAGVEVPLTDALQKVLGHKTLLEEAELDDKNNRLLWEIEMDSLEDQHDEKVWIDAVSGDVIIE
ncbi:MAG: PepSY domain-containing protein [Actinomycetaceae bacterium]|nr:PepSY domain-containing protein [Actinomycetaceae bacterium]